jgi:hypothetical protein
VAPLKIYNGEIASSLLANMCFPDDPERAECCAAHLLTDTGAAAEFSRLGFVLSPKDSSNCLLLYQRAV